MLKAYGSHGAERAPAREKVVTFDNPAAYARSVRATALLFKDPRSQEIHERISRLAQSDATVLITGETGTGKELAARELHRRSLRSAASFIAVNCAALPEHLVESELFGHERGAFTGAVAQKKGWFESANGGTLFLDEVGDLPLAMQVKLLRALQEREVTRVGGRTSIPVDVRFIAATNLNLEDAVRAGRFREDLYYRLNVARLALPPLRERPGDILPLVEHFLRLYGQRLGLPDPAVSPAAKSALVSYPWPGNIRELENVVQNALLVMRDNIVQPKDLNLTALKLLGDPAPVEADTGADVVATHTSRLRTALESIFQAGGPSVFARIDEEVIRSAYEFTGHNQVRAAQLLGVSRNILRHRLKLYHII